MSKYKAKMVHAGFGASRRPRIKATVEQAEMLRSIVADALIKEEKAALGSSLEDLLDRDPVVVVEQAIAELIRAKVYSTGIPELRSMVRKRKPGELRKALQALAKLLPEHERHDGLVFPPWRQMRAVFTGGNPFADDASHDGDMGREDEWGRKYAPGVLLAAVRQHLALMDRLDEMAKGTRPVEVPERRFVEGLAEYWKSTLGLRVLESRASGNPRGDFRDFIAAARELCPKGFKIGPLDKVVRECATKR